MMSQQWNERAIKAYSKPMWLDENAVIRARLIENPDRIIVGTKGIAAFIRRRHCTVYDYEQHRWCYYSLPTKHGNGWVLGRDSARLWGILPGGKLATFDLRSGEWIQFQHHLDYEAILYADESTVIMVCDEILAIDVLRLEGDKLRRVANIPISIIEPDFYTKSSAFWPEKNQFIVLQKKHMRESQNSSSRPWYTVWSLDWDGQSRAILDIEAYGALLLFPFVVMHNEQEKVLAYVDLRDDSAKLTSIAIHHEPERERWEWRSIHASIFGNDLIVIVQSSCEWEGQAAIIKLGEQYELLFYRNYTEHKEFFSLLWQYKMHQLGRFLLLGNEWAYDLVTRQEVRDVPWLSLLRQAILDEAELQQQKASAQTLSIPQQECEDLDLNTLRVPLSTLTIRFAEAIAQDVFIESAISSSGGKYSSVVLIRHSGTPSAYLLPQDDKPLQYLLLEKYGWKCATFDDKGQVWLCDMLGKHIAVVHPYRREALIFVLPIDKHLGVSALAAYNNILAVVHPKGLTLYRYRNKSLEEILHLKNEDDFVKIKPDVKKQGWWIVTKKPHQNRVYELHYLSLNEESATLEKMAHFDHPVEVLGDWPEEVYFVYVDIKKRELRYTLDPLSGWYHISLHQFSQKQPFFLSPISLFSVGDSVFVVLCTSNAYLLMNLQGQNAELISAFMSRNLASAEAKFLHWNNYLVLRSGSPLVFAQAYTEHAKIKELPENKGLLFFDLHTNQFHTRPWASYSAMDALRKTILRKAGSNSFLKPNLF
ncbi:MAG: hypothetical protein QXS54_03275 [Candidatus Methanomethylicaceae archaeon]